MENIRISGVSWVKNAKKWQARIGYNSKIINLGYYDDFDKAVLVRYIHEQKFYKNNMYIGYSPAEKYLREKKMIR